MLSKQRGIDEQEDYFACRADEESFAAGLRLRRGVVYRGIAFDPVPEPGTLVLLGAALAGLGAMGRRRRSVRGRIRLRKWRYLLAAP